MSITVIRADRREWEMYTDEENPGVGIGGRTVYLEEVRNSAGRGLVAFFSKSDARAFVEGEVRRKEKKSQGSGFGKADFSRQRGLEVAFVGKLTDGPSRYVPAESYTAQTQDQVLYDLELSLGHFPSESEVKVHWDANGWVNKAKRETWVSV